MERKWWHDKVAYQIYPKSFMDSNGDGIGDLKGIISKLDYLKELGVDIVWLSPIYQSPLADEGYDISDYYAIDPRFGTMEDMEELIAEAKKRDMTILMDLVVNHCSDEHEWFRKACEDPDGKYGGFFYLRDKDPEGKLPTNWRSYFGGPCWEELPGTDKLYMHVFHKKQPDLNWENPALREEVYKNIRWWMEKGIGGFRIDAIINIKKPAVLHDYPADRDDGLSSVNNMLAEAEGIGEFLGEMRDKAFAPYDAFTVGEVFNEKEEDLPLFIGDGGYFSTMFDFSSELYGRSDKGWFDTKRIDIDAYRGCMFGAHEKIPRRAPRRQPLSDARNAHGSGQKSACHRVFPPPRAALHLSGPGDRHGEQGDPHGRGAGRHLLHRRISGGHRGRHLQGESAGDPDFLQQG